MLLELKSQIRPSSLDPRPTTANQKKQTPKGGGREVSGFINWGFETYAERREVRGWERGPNEPRNAKKNHMVSGSGGQV